MSGTRPLRVLMLCAVGLLFVAGPDLTEQTQPAFGQSGGAEVRRALLMGVDRYKSREVPNLFGAANDVNLLAKVLSTRYGFSTANITKLTNEQATRAGMLQAMKTFVAAVGPNDLVYIHYSGHGSQVADKNQDEDDGKDETIIPHDGRTGAIADITDDEIAAILSGLKTGKTILVFDSCHSGTMGRHPTFRNRTMPMDERLELYKDPATVATRAIVPLTAANYTLFTGAHSSEQALDGPCEGTHHGLFSFSFARSLGSAQPNGTPRTIMNGVAKELSRLQAHFGLRTMPQPQLEAEKSRMDQPLFPSGRSFPTGSSSAPAEARLPWAELRREGQDKKTCVLVDGVALGGQVGSAWRIYRPKVTDFTRSRPIASATVTSIRGSDAICSINPPNALILSGARAVLAAGPPTGRSVPIRLTGGSSQALASRLATQAKHVEIVSNDGDARFRVEVNGINCDVYGITGNERLASIRGTDIDDLAKRLGSVMSRSQAAAELMSLDNPGSGIQLDARLVSSDGSPRAVEEVICEGRGVRVTPSVRSTAYRIHKPGEAFTAANSLMLEITCGQDCYITVIDVDAEGGVNLLFPNGYQDRSFYPQGRIGAYEKVLIPDSMRTPNRAGFNWAISAPAGTDSVRIFATSDLETAEMIRNYAVDASDTPVRRGLLADKLRSKLIRRGVTIVSAAASPGGSQPSGETYQPEPGRQPEGVAQPAPIDWTAVTVNFVTDY